MKYPILHLDFPIPVTIGSGRVVIDDAGVMRLDLFSPEDQVVVMEKLAPTYPEVSEHEHAPYCCEVTGGTVPDELSCDGECWCHSPHEEPPAYDPRAAGTLYPTNGLVHHGCCGCRDCNGGFAGGQQSSKVVEQPMHGAQEYVAVGLGRTGLGDASTMMCKGCGVLVGDETQHDYSHSKGRSQV